MLHLSKTRPQILFSLFLNILVFPKNSKIPTERFNLKPIVFIFNLWSFEIIFKMYHYDRIDVWDILYLPQLNSNGINWKRNDLVVNYSYPLWWLNYIGKNLNQTHRLVGLDFNWRFKFQIKNIQTEYKQNSKGI